jgi:ligand-binding sensor domain-containing protein
MRAARALITIAVLSLLGSYPALALDPSLDVSQYGHTAWTARDGFSVGTIFAMAQTPDGYLWLGSEFGLYRFDGVHAVPWQAPAGSNSRIKHMLSS